MTEIIVTNYDQNEPGLPDDGSVLLALTTLEPTLTSIADLHRTYYQLADDERLAQPIEKQISASEQRLGLRNKTDRAVEAMLCIDNPILSYAVITGSPHKPERLFGDDYWADHLDARIYATQAVGVSLDVELITDMQRLLTQRSAPETSGIIRDIEVRGGTYEDPYMPASYTPLQVEAIEAHPQLSFLPIANEQGDDGSKIKGFIQYPYRDEDQDIDKSITTDLEAITVWYNQARADANHNPYQLAADLQQSLIALHPFIDGNGRVSRLLMNWSLANDGCAPAILDDPSTDLVSGPEQWTAEVKYGSSRYEAAQQKKKALRSAGIEDLSALLDLGGQQAFYEHVYQYLGPNNRVEQDGPVTDSTVRAFAESFIPELERFEEFASKSIVIDSDDQAYAVNQGGLLTAEFIKHATAQGVGVLKNDIYRQLYSDLKVYRGGSVGQRVPDDDEILALFEGYTAFTSGYYAVGKANVDPKSLTPMSMNQIRGGFRQYNRALAAQYLERAENEGATSHSLPRRGPGNLANFVNAHMQGAFDPSAGEGAWSSPYVSTSVAQARAANFDALNSSSSYIVIESDVPKDGALATYDLFEEKGLERVQMKPGFMHSTKYPYSYEQEILIPGGIAPASISKATVQVSAGHFEPKVILEAERDSENPASITIHDRDNNMDRQYIFDHATGTFEFMREVPRLTQFEREVAANAEYHTKPVLSKQPTPSTSFIGKIAVHGGKSLKGVTSPVDLENSDV